jgi:hypothetical protein
MTKNLHIGGLHRSTDWGKMLGLGGAPKSEELLALNVHAGQGLKTYAMGEETARQ